MQNEQRVLEIQIRQFAGTNDGASNPGHGLSMSDVRARLLEAKRARDRALQRYVDFVIRGIVPQDLGI
jgi:hypothetical protein